MNVYKIHTLRAKLLLMIGLALLSVPIFYGSALFFAVKPPSHDSIVPFLSQLSPISSEGTVQNTNLTEKNLLLYFGFTHCAEECPTALNTMSKASMGTTPKYAEYEKFFVSIDAGDKPAQIAGFVRNFPPINGLWGSPETVKGMLKYLGMRFSAGQNGGQFNHENFWVMVRPNATVEFIGSILN